MALVSTNPITPAQLRFLENLLAAPALGIADVPSFVKAQRLDRLNSRDASTAIDQVRSLIKQAEAERAAELRATTVLPSCIPSGARYMTNRYPGTCVLCGQQVAAGEGYAFQQGGWRTVHATCPAEAPVVAQEPRNGACLAEILSGVLDGFYALPSKTGNNDLDFVVVHTNKGFYDPSRKGQRSIKRFVGGQGEVSIFKPEQIIFAKALAALTDEQRREACGLAGREINACGHCGRPLTDELSRQRGLGPICWEKAW